MAKQSAMDKVAELEKQLAAAKEEAATDAKDKATKLVSDLVEILNTFPSIANVLSPFKSWLGGKAGGAGAGRSKRNKEEMKADAAKVANWIAKNPNKGKAAIQEGSGVALSPTWVTELIKFAPEIVGEKGEKLVQKKGASPKDRSYKIA